MKNVTRIVWPDLLLRIKLKTELLNCSKKHKYDQRYIIL